MRPYIYSIMAIVPTSLAVWRRHQLQRPSLGSLLLRSSPAARSWRFSSRAGTLRRRPSSPPRTPASSSCSTACGGSRRRIMARRRGTGRGAASGSPRRFSRRCSPGGSPRSCRGLWSLLVSASWALLLWLGDSMRCSLVLARGS